MTERKHEASVADNRETMVSRTGQQLEHICSMMLPSMSHLDIAEVESKYVIASN
jgi:hypothetical protein